MLASVAFLLTITFYFSSSQEKKKTTSSLYHEGDVIFQASQSRQCTAVKAATHSDISHCGMLFKEADTWYVLEAVEPVSIVSLSQFINRGEGAHYQIKRLKKEFNTLTPTQIQAMKDLGKSWINRHYDIYFNWDYGNLYCSELVWKLYHDAAGIEVCAMKHLKDYDLSDALVKQIMQERYGANIPWEEPMVAPSDISASDKMTLVEQH